MCWFGFAFNRKIAKEDITCKKVVNYDKAKDRYFPYYRTSECTYGIGYTYSSPWLHLKKIGRKKNTKGLYKICEGLHCYSYRKDFEYHKLDGIVTTVGGREVRFTPLNKIHPIYPVVIECTIPKGTIYYENFDGEILTERLRFNRVLDI